MKTNETSISGKQIAGKKLFTFSILILLFMFFPVVLQAGTNWPQTQKLVDLSGNAYDLFGSSVSIDGDLAIVGAAFGESAFIFKWDGNSFSQQQEIVSGDGLMYVLFGSDVCISGDLVIVGSPDYYTKGAAYIFKWNGTSWIRQQRLEASDGAQDDYFGEAVAIYGDYAIVGAYQDDAYAGSAYVFKWNGASWVQQQKLPGAAGSKFGCSLAFFSDEMVIIGASAEDGNRGSAHVFTRSGEIWSEQQKLTAADGAGGDLFGFDIAIDGNQAIFGAYGDDTTTGSAYIFIWDGNNWSQQQKIIAADRAVNDDFGISVSISGDYALVGAYGDDGFTGSAYMFKWNGMSWSQDAKLIASDRMSPDSFGCDVSVSGGLALAGATYSNSYKGAAYAFKFCSAADLTGDCRTDLTDYAILANSWLDYDACGEANEWCSGSDYNESGTVDTEDLLELVLHWLDGI